MPSLILQRSQFRPKDPFLNLGELVTYIGPIAILQAAISL